MQPIPYRVLSREQDTQDVFTLHLAPTNGEGVGPYAAGQFNMLYVYGVGEIPISISGDPDDGEPLMHTTRAVGTVTKAMARLHEGAALGVRGPFGTAWPIGAGLGRDVVIVAGGIGLAPLRPAIAQIVHRRADFNKVVLLYGARTPEDLLFREDLIRWRDEGEINVVVTVDRATGGWLGNVGFVTELVRRAPFEPRNMMALICGPEIMMRYAIQNLNRRGVTDDEIFVTLERNMKCAVGFCGHCQLGPAFVCRDGPVFRYDRIRHFFELREV
jgi:NAD(P)H-flavin reductase